MSAAREVMLVRLPPACCGQPTTGQFKKVNLQYVEVMGGHPF